MMTTMAHRASEMRNLIALTLNSLNIDNLCDYTLWGIITNHVIWVQVPMHVAELVKQLCT